MARIDSPRGGTVIRDALRCCKQDRARRPCSRSDVYAAWRKSAAGPQLYRLTRFGRFARWPMPQDCSIERRSVGLRP